MKYFYIFLLSILIGGNCNPALSQCVQAVDFNTWTAEGHTLTWSVTSGGAELTQGTNANYPGFFVGPDTLINVKITGTFEVADCCSQTGGVPDDDYIGFVFGYQDPIGTPTTDCDFLLFDWKQNSQTYSGYFANEGFSLNRVDGNFPYTLAGTFPYFWEHTNSAIWQTLATDFSTTNGWVNYQSYDFTLIYTASRAIVMIDNDTIFDYQDCFEPGRFGFYNYSQAATFYSNFDYSLYVDFQFHSENICLGDTARIYFVDTGCTSFASAFSNIDTFYWDMGDGTVLTDTNPTHLYNAAGTYGVSLIATDIYGCTDTTVKDLYVQAHPIAQIDFNNGCAGDSVFFLDQTMVPGGIITSQDWTFSNGMSATGANPGVVFPVDGTYNVHYEAMTNAGCTATLDTTIVIYPLPQAAFSASPECIGDTVYFLRPIRSCFRDFSPGPMGVGF